ncbi:hypothetical protein [Bradyrhizobium guangzhouense]|uniref:hypothetical protein n=1 Tax=Bradyrhizobium guangzhouense TaxID=1325095 RepID=UPI001009FD2B|nr:hypothetical protein [Bradyrhizobium guangzhouense]RXH07282.1 hypothetical protein EAS54_38070 [Bradyrhizobium guangzhouense]
MIVKAYKYKKSEGARRLSGYLAQDAYRATEPGESRNLYVANALDGMRVMQCLQRASRARIAFWHIIISPTTQLDKKDFNRILNLIITELNAADHPLMVWSHEKLRARRGGGPTHFHCVLGHVSPITKLALDMRNHARRLHKVAAVAAFDLEGHTSISPYHDSIVTHLIKEDRPDVARWLTDLKKVWPSQQSRMTDAMRRSAAAEGLDLASFCARLERLWNSGASEQSFARFLSNAGVMIRQGDRSEDSILLFRRDRLIGVLHRILQQPRTLVYQEASARFSALFGKTIDADGIPEASLTSNIEKLRQDKTDDLEVLLKRLRIKTLKLTYLPAGVRVGSTDAGNRIAERLRRLSRGEAILDRALELLWSDDAWVCTHTTKTA